MFLFTKCNSFYAVLTCAFLSLTVGSFVYVGRPDYACSNYESKSLCYAAVGGISAGITGLFSGFSWRSWSNPVRAYASLMATMTTGGIFNLQMMILTYSETIQVLRHIQQLISIPFQVAQCLKDEMIHSIRLTSRSLFQESEVDELNRGVGDIVAHVDTVNRSQSQIKLSIEVGFKWLESRGLGCKDILTKPFEICLNRTEIAKKECRDSGAGTLCDVINIGSLVCQNLRATSKATCQDLGPNKISKLLSELRSRMSSWISGTIRMRVGILFELHTSSQVEDELMHVWDDFWSALNRGINTLTKIYEISLQLLKHSSTILLLMWPLFYLIYYQWGPLSFDNVYLPVEEVPSGVKITLPDVQIIPSWIPSPKELFQMIASLIFITDLILIVCVLLIDIYLTKGMDWIYLKLNELFNDHKNGMFDFLLQSDIEGIQWIAQMIAQKLDVLQQAAGLGRLMACLRPTPAAHYSFSVFIIALIQRTVYLYVKTKWTCLPGMICARFYRERHELRMRHLIVKISSSSMKVSIKKKSWWKQIRNK